MPRSVDTRRFDLVCAGLAGALTLIILRELADWLFYVRGPRVASRH